MSDKQWKQWERDFAKALGGARFWANSGEALDCETPMFVGQAKNVKSMSLNAIVDLACSIEAAGEMKDKIGVVGIKNKPGKGKRSDPIIVMTLRMFQQLYPTQQGE